jgi:hypothetical protein
VEHEPLLQILPGAQVLPFATGFGAASLQTGAPVVQTIAPLSQTFAGVHAASAVHALHEPSWQTMSVPHEVPFVTLLAVSVQAGVPVEQLVDPT